MNFKPGDKVWIDVPLPGYCVPPGPHAGTIISLDSDDPDPGWWLVNVEGHHPPAGTEFSAHERYMRRRYDPPDWVKLCKLDEVRPSMPRELV